MEDTMITMTRAVRRRKEWNRYMSRMADVTDWRNHAYEMHEQIDQKWGGRNRCGEQVVSLIQIKK